MAIGLIFDYKDFHFDHIDHDFLKKYSGQTSFDGLITEDDHARFLGQIEKLALNFRDEGILDLASQARSIWTKLRLVYSQTTPFYIESSNLILNKDQTHHFYIRLGYDMILSCKRGISVNGIIEPDPTSERSTEIQTKTELQNILNDFFDELFEGVEEFEQGCVTGLFGEEILKGQKDLQQFKQLIKAHYYQQIYNAIWMQMLVGSKWNS